MPVTKVPSPLIFEWPALQRWGISENRLPPGSEILFRNPTVWEQYRAYILAVIAAILIQSALISWLLYEHWRRQRAEILARNTMSELTHVNRMATAGQLSASIAHEVRQPLAGIVANAQAALRWLEKANVEEVREGLKGIVSDGHRASDIITNLRAMFKSDVQEKTLVDINKLVLSVLALVRIDLQKHEIEASDATRRSNSTDTRQSGSVTAGDFELGHECHRVDGFIANSRAAHKNRTEPIQYSACVDRRHRDGH